MNVRWLAPLIAVAWATWVWGEEGKPVGPTPEMWLNIRALSAETHVMEERFGRLNAELAAARQGFIERRAQWDAAVTDLAKIMHMDPTTCMPDPIARTWVPRRPDVKECAAQKAP